MKNYLLLFFLAFGSYHVESQNINTELYEYVKNSPENNDDEAVISYLQKGGKNQKEQAELIAYWIMENVSYDIEAYTSGNYQSSNWDVTFYSKKGVCAGYANLFKELCERLHIECLVVSGYAKGYSYDPNVHFTESNHAWNIVIIGDDHYLFDVTWASGYATEMFGELEYIKFPKTAHLFASPEEFVEKHLPSQRRWQLLDHPISLDQFEKFSTYEEMQGLNPDLYNYNDSIDGYLKLDFIDRRLKDVEENLIVNPDDQGIPIDYEHIAHAYSQNHINQTFLQLSKHYYQIAKSKYMQIEDKKRCDYMIDYVNFYLDSLNGE